MIEGALVVIAIVSVGLVGFLAAVPPASLATAGGLGILLLGLLIGVPSGLWYHVALYRLVSARMSLPRTWWLSPSSLHRHLTDEERRQIARWYRVGGVGFVLCLAGGLAAIGSLLIRW